MISEFEFDDVIKNIRISIMVIMDSILLKISELNIWNMVSEILVKLFWFNMLILLIIWFMVRLLNIDIYISVINVGISKIVIMNLWMVCFLEICVMNMFMNGDYEIYYV